MTDRKDKELHPNIEATLTWMIERGDRNVDGYIECREDPHSPRADLRFERRTDGSVEAQVLKVEGRLEIVMEHAHTYYAYILMGQGWLDHDVVLPAKPMDTRFTVRGVPREPLAHGCKRNVTMKGDHHAASSEGFDGISYRGDG